MSETTIEIPTRGGNLAVVPPLPDTERKGLTKKELAALPQTL